MNSVKSYLILLLAATTIGGAVLAWKQYGDLIELRAAAMNTDERADLQKRVWDLEKANRELREKLTAQRDPNGRRGGLREVLGRQHADEAGRSVDDDVVVSLRVMVASEASSWAASVASTTWSVACPAVSSTSSTT